MSDLPTEAMYTRFVQEVTNVESAIYEYRLQNAKYGDSEEKVNAGFEKVMLFNAPADFMSFDKGDGVTTGYLINLATISYTNAEFGQGYETTEKTFTFDQDDVYVYDATGSVYYVKGIEYKKTRVYSLANASSLNEDSTVDGPIISNIVVTSGEIENPDGTTSKTNAKAKILVSAFPRNDGVLTVVVRNNVAEKVDESTGTYATQVLRNGTYSIIVTEEGGGRTVTQVTVTGIQESVEPPKNLSMRINDGAATTQIQRVTIDLRADGATWMMITKEPNKPSSRDSKWQRYQERFDYELGNTEGKVTLYAWFKDDLNNVADTIVQASIIYDGTPPTTNQPTLTQSGPYIIIGSNQTDRQTKTEILLANTEYGFAEYDGTNAGEFVWGKNSVVTVPKNKQLYVFATRTKDEAGNTSTSEYAELYINYDFIIEFRLEEFGEVYATMTANAGEVATLPSDIPTKLGYHFAGWSEQPNQVAGIPAGGSYLAADDGVMIKKLYAAWAPRTDIPYTVKHYVEKLDIAGQYDLRLEEKLEGTTGNDVYAVAKNTGEFEGLIENTSHPNRLVMAKIQVDGSTVLSIYYTRQKFNLTVTAEHGSATGTTLEIPVETLVKISNTPDEGYQFDRWTIENEPDGSDYYKNFVNNNGVLESYATFKMLGHDTVLIAKNIAKLYNIEYHLDGGAVEKENPVTYSRETEAFTLNNPVKTGYNFVGWQGTGIAGTEPNVTIDVTKIPIMSDRVYYAVYEPLPELLTMEADPYVPTNDVVRVKVSCMDPELLIQYKVGNLGTWENYTATINVDENTTVYARALRNGLKIDEEQIVIANIDREKPVITTLMVSENWEPGTRLKIRIVATDDVGMGKYIITNSNVEPADSAFSESDEPVIVDNGINYAWAQDLAGNVTSKAFFVWDIGETENRRMYAILIEETYLIISGSGTTKSYSSENEVPYTLYKDKIETVRIDKGVTTIGNYAMSNLRNMKTLNIGPTLTTFEDNALMYSNNYNIITIDAKNTSFSYEDFTLYDKSKSHIYMHSTKDAAQFFTIENTVTSIGNYAFYDNDKILKITANSNASLGNSALENMDNLFEITGMIGGTSIGNRAFADCRKLETMSVSTVLETIGTEAFLNTASLEKISLPKTVTLVGKEDLSSSGVFKNIGIYTVEGKGTVEYYQSARKMRNYALAYSDEANFVMIDDVSPALNALKITSPVTGTYAQGTKVEITAEYDEELSTSHADGKPTLVIKVGNGTSKTVTTSEYKGNTIVYTYTIEADDVGVISLISYTGKVYDLLNNVTTITSATLTGNTITVDTVIRLEEGSVTTYYIKLQDAINAAKSRPETPSKITVLRDLTESVQILSDKYLDINMNGKVLTGESDRETIRNQGKVTIRNNGKITSDTIVLANQSGASLALEGMTINSSSVENPAVVVAGGATFEVETSSIMGAYRTIENSGQTTIRSTTIKSTAQEAIFNNKDSVLNIIESEVTATLDNEELSAIVVSEGATVIVEETTISTQNGIALRNAGNLEIKGTSLLTGLTALKNTGDARIDTATLSNSTAAYPTVINDGKVEINSGMIVSGLSNAIVNSSDLLIKGGSITSESVTENTIENTLTAKTEITGGTIYSKNTTAIANEGTLAISGSATITSEGNDTITNKVAGIINMSGGTIEQLNIDGAAIRNEKTLNITDGKITSNGRYGIITEEVSNLSIDSLEITGTTDGDTSGIHNKSVNEVKITGSTINVVATAGNAYGIYNDSPRANLIFRDSTVKAESPYAQGFAVYNRDGKFTLGNSADTIVVRTPVAEGSEYGYYAESGEFAFYDGKVIGDEGKSIYGTVNTRPESSYVNKTSAGGRETALLIVDTIKPSVSLRIDYSTWRNEALTLTGRATDYSAGIKAYAFTKTNAEPEAENWNYLTTPVQELERELRVSEYSDFYFHVIDEAGNYAISNVITALFDNVPPRIESIIQNPVSETWTKGPATVTVTAKDEVSKINLFEITTIYRHEQAAGNYTEITPVSSFNRTFTSNNQRWHIYIKDQAGNVTYAEWEVSNIDSNAPTITLELVEYESTAAYVKVTAEDFESGVADLYVNGVKQSNFTVNTDGKKEMTYAIENSGIYTFKATDKVGNEAIKDVPVYAISYDKNGGDGVVASQIKVEGMNLQVADNGFTREGYSFMHWNTKPDGTGDTYPLGSMYTKDESVMMYAIWKDITNPEFVDIKTAASWTPGSNVQLEIVATDNLAVTKYQITTTNTTPTTWETSPIIEVSTTETNLYAWIADDAGNTASMAFKMYDISTNTNPKSVVAITKDITKNRLILSIEGKGATKDFDEASVPWLIESTRIKEANISAGVTKIGKYVLSNLNSVEKIIITSTVVSIDKTAFVHTNNFDEIVVEGNNFAFIEGVFYDGLKQLLYISTTKNTNKELTTPEGLLEIAPYAFEESNLEKVQIFNNIDIPEGAFKNATSLKEIISNNGIGGKSIGMGAFEGCLSLEEIDLSKDLELLGDRAFYDARMLDSIIVGKKITSLGGETIFVNIGANAVTNNVYYYESNALMSEYAARFNTQATFIPIDDVKPTITSVLINNGAEYTKTPVVTLDIVASDNHEEKYLYITEDSKYVPTGIELGWIPFNAEQEYEFEAGNGVKSVYVWVKDAANNVSDNYATDSITVVQYEFELHGSEDIVQYVDTTGKDYFIYREQGFDIDGEGVTVEVEGTVNHKATGTYEIKHKIMFDTTLIETITRTVKIIPNTWNTTVYTDGNYKFVTHAGGYAKIVGINALTGFTEIDFPETVSNGGTSYKVIDFGDGTNPVLPANTDVTKITFSEGTINVGKNAFNKSYALCELEYTDALMSIGEYAFANSHATYEELLINDNVRIVRASAFENTKIKNIIIEDGVYEIADYAFKASNSGSAESELKIPASIRAIGKEAFYGVDLNRISVDSANTVYKEIYNQFLVDIAGTQLLKYVTGNSAKETTIPEGIGTICQGAFAESNSLQKVTFNGTETTIMSNAFRDSTKLKTIENYSAVGSVGGYAFANTILEEFIVSDNLITIGEFAFSNTKLKTASIKKNVTSIGNQAFGNMTTFTSVVFEGAPTIAGDTFKGSTNMQHLLALDLNKIIPVNGTLQVENKVIVYVLMPEQNYENDPTWGVLGTDRIRPVAEIVGEKEITLEYDSIYNEQGIKLFGEHLPTGEGQSSYLPDFKSTKESNLDVTILGDYTVKYTIHYKDEEIFELIRTIHIVDTTPPEIISVVISEGWGPGNTLLLAVNAQDGYDSKQELQYAIADVNMAGREGMLTWTPGSTEETVSLAIAGTTNYIYVKDKSNNIAETLVYAWDISKNTDKKVYAYYNNDSILEVEGNGETLEITNVGETPWKEYNNKIKTLQVNEGTTHLGKRIVSGLEVVEKITLPATLTNIALDAFAKTNNFSEITVASDNERFKVLNLYTLIDMDETTIYAHSRRDTNSSYTVPNTVTIIAPFAFYRNDNLVNVHIITPFDVGESAFENCTNLKTIEGAEIGRTYIGSNAFKGCYALEDITLQKTITEIGTEMFVNVPGPVSYYASCKIVKAYAKANPNETEWILIDDVPPTTDAPVLKASSSTIVATLKQYDEDTALTAVQYNIRIEDGDYDDTKWQDASYFLNLKASTGYYVKTKATDSNYNTSESEETYIVTEAVPDNIRIYAMPVTPTNQAVTVVIEWPENEIEALYGDEWPEEVDVERQIGTQLSGEALPNWNEVTGTAMADPNKSSTEVIVDDYGTTVYARLFDGTNYTAKNISLTVLNIDKVPPQGTVIINSNDIETLTEDVKLTLVATDDRSDTQGGVKMGVHYYYATEEENPDLTKVSWKAYTEGVTTYDYTLEKAVTASRVAKVNVWYKDAAGNISEKASDTITLIAGSVRLKEGTQTTYYYKLKDAVNAASKANPAEASRITLLRNIQQEGKVTFAEGQNIILEMNGLAITQTSNSTITALENNGILAIRNAQGGVPSSIVVTTTTGNAVGIYNTGLLDMDDVSVEVTAPGGTATAIHNKNIK
ncbi:MAG: leucine-rich repeat protein [Clostridia bacterium]|nr:leucine-rich repeat protein [Clostridia bacterium]